MGKDFYRKLSETLWFSFNAKVIWLGGALLFLGVAFFNLGLIALDDYSCIVSQTIPAQQISFSKIINNLGIRHPLAVVILGLAAKVILKFGVYDPMNQISLIKLLIGICNFSVFSFFGSRLFQNSGSIKHREWVLGLLCLYFLNPLIFTRPMIESLSAPFLFLAGFEAFRYWNENNRKCIALCLAFLTVASMFRFQVGVCALGLGMLIIKKRDLHGFKWFSGSAIILFLLSGFLEVLITGRFHGSLRDYVVYNLNYSSGYGVTPFYTFFVLLAGLTLPPSLFSRFKGFDWKREYQSIFPIVLFVGIFVLSHSVVPHKEERFMIPILPLFLVILVPLLTHLTSTEGNKWRVAWFVTLNMVLLFVVSFSTPQSNSINLVKYLGKRSDLKNILSVEQTLVLFPSAYVLHVPAIKTLTLRDVSRLTTLDCSDIVAIREDYVGRLESRLNKFNKISEFKPGPLEALLVKLNPKQNLRRGSISIYADPKCVSQF